MNDAVILVIAFFLYIGLGSAVIGYTINRSQPRKRSSSPSQHTGIDFSSGQERSAETRAAIPVPIRATVRAETRSRQSDLNL